MSDYDELEAEWGLATQAVRAGQSRSHEQEHSEPIFLTSSFVFSSAAEAAARFAGDQPGNIYSRFTNPTVHTFEQRLRPAPRLSTASKAAITSSHRAVSLVPPRCYSITSWRDWVLKPPLST